MAITETSLYTHCPSNFPVQVPISQVWTNQDHDGSQCHTIQDYPTFKLGDPKVTDHPLCYPVDLISPTATKRINARKILDYIRKIIRKQTLCKKHEQDLDQSLAELQLIYQQSLSSEDCHSKDELGEQTDHALLYSFLQLKKVTHCPDCQSTLKASQDNRAAFDAPGTRINQTGLIWALLRNWCDVFRSRSSQARKQAVKNRTVIRRRTPLGSNSVACEATDLPEPIDKSAYCWQWLLTQPEPVSTITVTQPLHPTQRLDRLCPVLEEHSSASVTTVPSRFIGSGSSVPRCSARIRSHSLSDLSMTKASWSLVHQAQVQCLPLLVQEPDQNRHKSSSSSSPRRPYIDTSTGQSLKPKAARCTQLPHHVARRPRFRMNYKSHGIRSTPSQPHPAFGTRELPHTFQTRSPIDKEAMIIDSNKSPCWLNPYTCHKPQPPPPLPPQHQQKYQNQRTINFLQSLSPNMNVVPPPNHNPFMVKSEVR